MLRRPMRPAAAALLFLCLIYAGGARGSGTEPLGTQEAVQADQEPCSAFIQVRLNGSDDPFAAEALVAAGGSLYPSAVHRADVRVMTSPPVSGEGVSLRCPVRAAYLLAGTSGSETRQVFLTTGVDGTAWTTYVSSNVSGERVTLELLSKAGRLLDTATIFQVWDDDEGPDFNVPRRSFPGEATCRFTCRLREGVPIDGHDIRWYMRSLHLHWFESNMDTGKTETGEGTFEEPFAALPFGLKPEDFFSVSPTVERAPGVYSADIVTHHHFEEPRRLPKGLLWRQVQIHQHCLAVYDAGLLEAPVRLCAHGILGLLKDEALDPGSRAEAVRAMRDLTGDDFGYDLASDASTDKNRAAIARFEEWVREHAQPHK